MTRVSLVEAYDNRSVIKQIFDLKQQADEATEASQNAGELAGVANSRVAGAVNDASQAIATANGLAGQIQAAQATADGANTAAEQAERNAGNAVYTANQANETANNLSGRIATQDTTIGTLVKTVVVETTATDGKVKATLQGGTAVESAIPIASGSKAGLMNSQTFNTISGNTRRIDALESGANTWYVVFVTTAPTQEQITTAYNDANPGVPVKIGYRVIDLSKNLTFVYDGAQWIRPASQDVPLFVQGQAGTIKGGDPATDGVVIAETNGTGSVQGWADLKGRVASTENRISTNETAITGINSRLTTAEGTLATASQNATQALSDAATAQSTATYAKNTVDSHTSLIAANTCHATSYRLEASVWSGTTAPFAYALRVDGLGANDIVWFAPTDSASAKAMGSAGVFAIGQTDGVLNITADTKPTDAIYVNVVRRGA